MKKIAIAGKEDQIKNYLHTFELINNPLIMVDKDVNPEEYDGLLLPGGADVNPNRYGETMNGSHTPDDELDEFQFSVLDKFVKANKPVFGICRGHQLINVYFNGTLVQDIEYKDNHAGIDFKEVYHEIDANENNFLSDLYGLHFVTNSSHHQVVKTPGEGFVVDAYSKEGYVEAMHHQTKEIYTVQFHPERMCFDLKKDESEVDGSKVLEFFLSRC